ncbi:MAG TPA: universal stress protein [Rubrobacter sp.]|jgi:nucleotide-binding universal stress UspA family protein|nr:universal stress protein [Rubrobacter sp.]
MSVHPERILLPTDGSEDSIRAAEAAADLAKKSGAELHVVHVWHDVRGFAHDFVKRELRRQGQEILDEQVEKIRASGGEVTKAYLRRGRTSNEVIALCKEIDAGLLVVGSRGLGTVRRILMGSQSEEIVHHAQVPVLVLTGAENFWPPARIVVGEDFSDDARKAGELAASIGKFYDAKGLLVYSHPDLPEVPPEEARSAVQHLTEMRERDKSMLEDRAGDLEKILGNRPEIKISGGYPANVLLEASQEMQPSIVAVGSRGLAGLIRTRLGSVSTKVVTAARGPVLVYPHVD